MISNFTLLHLINSSKSIKKIDLLHNNIDLKYINEKISEPVNIVSFNSLYFFRDIKENNTHIFPDIEDKWIFLRNYKINDDIVITLYQKYNDLVLVFDAEKPITNKYTNTLSEIYETVKDIMVIYNSTRHLSVTFTGDYYGGSYAQFAYVMNAIGESKNRVIVFNSYGLPTYNTAKIENNLDFIDNSHELYEIYRIKDDVEKQFISAEVHGSLTMMVLDEVDSYKMIRNIIFKHMVNNMKKKDISVVNYNTDLIPDNDNKFVIKNGIFDWFRSKKNQIELKDLDILIKALFNELVIRHTMHLYYKNNTNPPDNLIHYYLPSDVDISDMKYITNNINISVKNSNIIQNTSKFENISIHPENGVNHFFIFSYEKLNDLFPGRCRYSLLSNIFLMYVKLYNDERKTTKFKLNKLYETMKNDEDFFNRFRFKKFYKKVLRNITPFYVVKNKVIVGSNFNCKVDNIQMHNEAFVYDEI